MDMKQIGLRVAACGLAVLVFGAAWSHHGSEAAIHEIVAAYCSGGGVGVIGEDGHLRPPPITTFGHPAFAKPVIASGAVDPGTFTVTDKPNTKYKEGSDIFALDSTNVDHASAERCRKNALP
jgi:hypothetical protein